MLFEISLCTVLYSILGAALLAMLYTIVLKPLYLIRYYAKQGAVSEYFPILGGFVKNLIAAANTGDMLSKYKRVVTHEKPDTRFFATNIGSDGFILLVDPILIKEFVQNQDKYVKHAGIIEIVKETLGNGLVTSEGQVWKKHRKIASQAFHFEFIKDSIPVIVQATQEALDSIASGDLSKVNMLEEFQKITGETTGRIFFGQEFMKMTFNGMVLPLAVADIEGRAMMEQLGVWNNLFGPKFVKAGILPKHKKMMDDIRRLRKLCMDFVIERKAQRKLEKEQGVKQEKERKNLLDILLDYQEIPSAESLSDEEIVDEFLTFFFAGTDTTGHALAMAAYYLNKSPEAYEESVKEAYQIIKNQDSLTLEKIDEMKYTLGVLKEILRLANPAYMVIGRGAVEDHNLGDLKIKKGTRVSFLTGLNCIKSEYFDNPDKFQPERWLPENEATNNKWKKQPYSYVPFSSGARNCIGQHFALLEGRIILGMFLKRFEMALPDNYKLRMGATFMYAPIDPLLMRLKLRSNS